MNAETPTWLRTAALPVRGARCAVRVGRAALRGRPVILMYHHVADVAVDPWTLAVSPRHFAQHLDILRRTRRPVLPLRDLVGAVAAYDVPPRAIAITFDDGYANNVTVALPALERAGMPATFFVATGAIDARREMWWDELERIVLSAPRLPDALDVDLAGSRVAVTLDGSGASGAGWRAAERPPRTARERLYRDLWERISGLSDDGQRRALDTLAAWAGVDVAPRATHRMATSDELDRLARSELAEVGSHSVTHGDLTLAPESRLHTELSDSKAELERRTGGSVTSFAYPSGRHDARVVDAVGAAGYDTAVTTRGAPVREDDPLCLPRYHVADQSGVRFARTLAQLG